MIPTGGGEPEWLDCLTNPIPSTPLVQLHWWPIQNWIDYVSDIRWGYKFIYFAIYSLPGEWFLHLKVVNVGQKFHFKVKGDDLSMQVTYN